jgi:hypothetical protein
MKSGNLNFLETSGPIQASNGTGLALPFLIHTIFYKPDETGHNDLIMATEQGKNFSCKFISTR